MANFFPGGKQQDKSDPRPATPTETGSNNFITPISTPQGSHSKKMVPPGANDLPVAFDSMKLNAASAFDSPVKLGRPQSVTTPLSRGRSNLQNIDEGSPSVDSSIIHKAPTSTGSPLKSQGQENTPPAPPRDGAPAEPAATYQPSHAALSRQELYQTRERPSPTVRRFNTQRGLTPQELEMLQKPNVKRLVNVTQLCKLGSPRVLMYDALSLCVLTCRRFP